MTKANNEANNEDIYKQMYFAYLDYQLGKVEFLDVLETWKTLLGIEIVPKKEVRKDNRELAS